MLLVTFDFEHTILRSGAFQLVFINESKSCKISSQMFFNVMFFFSKTRDKLIMTEILQNKTASNELNEAYLEPSQTLMRKHFCKKLHCRCSTWF